MPFINPVILDPRETERVLDALKAAKSAMYKTAARTKVSAIKLHAFERAKIYQDLEDSITRRASQFGGPEAPALHQHHAALPRY